MEEAECCCGHARHPAHQGERGLWVGERECGMDLRLYNSSKSSEGTQQSLVHFDWFSGWTAASKYHFIVAIFVNTEKTYKHSYKICIEYNCQIILFKSVKNN